MFWFDCLVFKNKTKVKYLVFSPTQNLLLQKNYQVFILGEYRIINENYEMSISRLPD